jgi:hypothetical protein
VGLGDVTAADHTVVIPGNHYHGRVSERLAELGTHGLKLDQDYTWAYYPRRDVSWWDNNNEDGTWAVATPAHTCVTFVDPKWATYFGLKWA